MFSHLVIDLQIDGEGFELDLNNRVIFDVIYENMDEFCQALSPAEHLSSLSFAVNEQFGGQKLEINQENRDAWNKFFTTHNGRAKMHSSTRQHQ